MSPALLLLAPLVALLLLAIGLVGRQPKRGKGWVTMAPSVRAGCIVFALVIGSVSLAYRAGWLGGEDTEAKLYASDRTPTPPTPDVWSQAASAQREADARKQAGEPEPAPIVDEPAVAATSPVPDAAPTPTPAPDEPALASPAAVPDAWAAAKPPSAHAPPVVAAAREPTMSVPRSAQQQDDACECEKSSKPQKAAATIPRPASGASASAPRPSTAVRRSSSRDGRVSVCDLERQYGTSRRYGDSWAAVPVSAGVSSSGAVSVHNQLGPGQRAEVLRVRLDSGVVSELNLGPGRRTGSIQLAVPPGGAVRYQLDGYTEFSDGRRVPIEGEGWLDGGWSRFEVRAADVGYGGLLFLEPA